MCKNTEENGIMKCAGYVAEKIGSFRPEAALVLGSGLGGLADELKQDLVVPYTDIPDFPVSTVQGHNGRFVFAEIDGVRTVIMQGRVHYYEGYSPAEAVRPIRLMKLLGAERLFLTNAAGGINEAFNVGDLMLIRDHISFLVPSPLIGRNIDALGQRFPDMSRVYSERIADTARSIAASHGVVLREGVYVQTSGPNYETPAEIRMLRTLGADAVGMSTAIEAMAARHCGMEVCGISVISNMAAGILPQPLMHEEVQLAADKVAPVFKKLVRKLITESRTQK